ncbi:MAG: DUF3341 domain-containing protein [Pirellulales bacterium]
MESRPVARKLYGLMASFHEADELLHAAQAAYAAGYRKMDGFSSFPVEGLDEALGVKPTRLPWGVLAAGITGGCTGFALQYYCNVISYPLNIGGRPLFSWPAYIPVTFELTILFAAFFTVLGMLAANGLPMPYHPVFNVTEFGFASRDKFFLCIETTDPQFDLTRTREFLESLHPDQVNEVPR